MKRRDFIASAAAGAALGVTPLITAAEMPHFPTGESCPIKRAADSLTM